MNFVDLVTSRIMLPARNRLKGDRRYSFVSEVERLNSSSIDVIRAHQLGRLRHIIKIASKTPFYRERIENSAISDINTMTFDEFRSIEPIDKSLLRENTRAMVSPDADGTSLEERRTGGTTSAPAPFLIDQQSVWRRESATAAFNAWYGFRPGQRIAYVWAAQQDSPSAKSWRARFQREHIDRKMFLPAVVDQRDAASHVNALRSFRPVLLQGYPTPLGMLAEYMIEQGEQVSVGAVSTTAEALPARQRRLIAKAFGLEPFEWYGAREAGRIASQCVVRADLHINAYGLHVEVEGDPNEEGSCVGELIVTDLWSDAMPLVRYRIGDVGVFATGSCPCGSQLPRLKRVYGRVTDLFLTSSGEKIPGLLLNDLIHSGEDEKEIAGGRTEIEKLQIVQHDYRKFSARVVPGRHFDEQTPQRLRTRLAKFLGETTVDLDVQLVDDIPPEPSGKLRLIKNLMPEAAFTGQ